jgi:hypothetical protein
MFGVYHNMDRPVYLTNIGRHRAGKYHAEIARNDFPTHGGGYATLWSEVEMSVIGSGYGKAHPTGEQDGHKSLL